MALIEDTSQSRAITETLNNIMTDAVYIFAGADPTLALEDPSVPKMGDVCAYRTDLRVVERRAERIGAGKVSIKITYGREGITTGDEEQEEEEVEMAAEQGLISYDKDGELIYDAATKEVGIEGYIPRGVLVFTRWKSFVNKDVILSHIATVNDSSWKGYDKETLLFLGTVSARTGHAKWRLTYRFLFNPEKHWVRKPLLQAILVDSEKLDAENKPIPETKWEPVKYPNGDPIIGLIMPYCESNFRELGLGG